MRDRVLGLELDDPDESGRGVRGEAHRDGPQAVGSHPHPLRIDLRWWADPTRPPLGAGAEEQTGQGEQLEVPVRPLERGGGEEPQTQPGAGGRSEEVVEGRSSEELNAGDLRHRPIQQDELSRDPAEELLDHRSPLPDGGHPHRHRRPLLEGEAVGPEGLRGFAAERRDGIGLDPLQLVQELGEPPVYASERAEQPGHGDGPGPARDGAGTEHPELHRPLGTHRCSMRHGEKAIARPPSESKKLRSNE